MTEAYYGYGDGDTEALQRRSSLNVPVLKVIIFFVAYFGALPIGYESMAE